jgi:DNA-directed RNA polymerase subunit L
LNLKINPAGEGSIKVEIEREDYSLADIVHKELLNVKHVKFSGVAPPHPLIKTLTLEVSTDSNNPTKALKEALELSKGRVSELLILAKEAFPQAPSASEKVGSEVGTPRTEAATTPSDDESSFGV